MKLRNRFGILFFGLLLQSSWAVAAVTCSGAYVETGPTSISKTRSGGFYSLNFWAQYEFKAGLRKAAPFADISFSADRVSFETTSAADAILLKTRAGHKVAPQFYQEIPRDSLTGLDIGDKARLPVDPNFEFPFSSTFTNPQKNIPIVRDLVDIGRILQSDHGRRETSRGSWLTRTLDGYMIEQIFVDPNYRNYTVRRVLTVRSTAKMQDIVDYEFTEEVFYPEKPIVVTAKFQSTENAGF